MNVRNFFKSCRCNRKDINIHELNEILKVNETILLDVRSPQEYKESHLNRINKYTTI